MCSGSRVQSQKHQSVKHYLGTALPITPSRLTSFLCVCVQMETNPILKNITDYLIEEVSAEEEELIGASGCNTDDAGDAKDPASSDVTLETDDKLLKVGGASCRSGAACFM